MSQTMQAAFFAGERALQIREVPDPEPGPGEVLLDVRACGVCGSDLHQYAGRWPQPPFIPGHEIAGEIRAVGEGVLGWQPGDRACVEPFLYCGACRYCMAGRYYQCPQMGFLTLTAHGGFAEAVVCPAYTLYRLPANLDFVAGALVEPLAVGVHAARVVGVCGTDEVLVLGAGTIGLMAAAAAKAFGARHVIVSARHEFQAEAARRFGCVATLATGTEELRELVGKAFPDGPSVVIETVGSAHGTFQQAIDLAGRLGRVALLGGNTAPVDGFDFSPIPTKELTVSAPLAYSQIGTKRDFEVAVELLAAGPEAYRPLATHRFELAQIQEAFELAMDKGRSRALKAMMTR